MIRLIRKRNINKQKGAVLVLFAMLAFAFLGIAALAVDMGMAFLAQSQMQDAAESSALEAMRHRDSGTDGRERAASMLSRFFADSGDQASGDLRVHGAGPVAQVSGSVGGLLEVPASPFYKPELELNSENSPHGDLVSGDFIPGQDPTETEDYARDDFTPAPPESAGDAYLVRLRRTGELPDPGAASSGPRLPLLFGRGSLVREDSTLREEGVAVRATAISQARRVSSVGLPNLEVDPPLLGAMPIGLERSFWENLLAGSTVTVEIDSAGVLSVAGAGLRQGQAISTATAIGAMIVNAPFTTAEPLLEGYFPVYQDVLGTERVIGFGWARMSLETAGSPATYALSKTGAFVAPENAAASWSAALNGLDAADRESVLEAHRGFSDPLLAAVIVR